MSQLIVVGALILGLQVAQPALPSQPSGTLAQAAADRPATPEIETLIREAIEDRLAAGDLPGGGPFRNAGTIALRRELPGERMTLSDDALPRPPGRAFYLTSVAAEQAVADQTSTRRFFLIVDRPEIDGETATLWLGTDVVFPSDPKLEKLCCCSSHGQFRRVNGRWMFVKWLVFACA